MARKGKLLAALDAHKGRDFEAEKRKKQLKDAEKRKRKRAEADDNDDDDEELSAQENGTNGVAISAATGESVQETFEAFSAEGDEDDGDNSEDEDEDDSEEAHATTNRGIIPQPDTAPEASASEAEDESDLALSDLSEEDREDIIPHQRMTINNSSALTASRKRVSIVSDKPTHPFHYHNSLVSTDSPADTLIPDPMDDETRELMFYKIARDATITARTLLKKEKIPFSRPTDYFAEMVKTDDHMEKVKKKLYDEASSKKAAEEARRLRDAKKFGKKVQIAKEQERAKEKKDTLNKIQELKRKRKQSDTGRTTEGEDLFEEINVDSSSKPDSESRRGGGDSKRQKRDSKFGFGGKKKYSKSGTAESSGDLSGFKGRGMKSDGGRGRGGARGGSRGGARDGRGGARGSSRGGRGGSVRPGKSRRVGAAGRG